jgi:hypothetical protein
MIGWRNKTMYGSITASWQRPVWQPISTAPLDQDVEVRVADQYGYYTLKFPCRLTAGGWVNASMSARLAVEPTHWRERKPHH